MPSLSDKLREEYENLFNTCSIRPTKTTEVESITKKIKTNQNRYETLDNLFGIPWYLIGVIHNMETGLSFKRHLHNGDPLTARTIHVPSGRPPKGNPPFTWEESAADAIQYERLDKWKDWSIAGILFKLELYNGWGYRSKHPHVLSPYLWSYSNHYTSGKFIKDGLWSETAVSKQCGAAVLLRRMAEKGDVQIRVDTPSSKRKPVLKYSNRKIKYGIELQQFLNKFPDIFLKEDGKPGKKTSGAVKKVFGFYLYRDPRG